jgi:hypothetical protein
MIGLVGAAMAQVGYLNGDGKPDSGGGSSPGAQAAPAGRLDIDPTAPQPDENQIDGAARQAPNLTFSYFRQLGSTFDPRTTDTTYLYNFNGCIHLTAGDNRVMVDIQIPNGSTIKYLRGYVNDTSNSQAVNLWLTRFEPGVSSSDLIAMDSGIAYNSGYKSFLSQEITQTVDTVNYSYMVIAGMPNNATAITQLCGIRVAYYAPVVFTLFAPLTHR